MSRGKIQQDYARKRKEEGKTKWDGFCRPRTLYNPYPRRWRKKTRKEGKQEDVALEIREVSGEQLLDDSPSNTV